MRTSEFGRFLSRIKTADSKAQPLIRMSPAVQIFGAARESGRLELNEAVVCFVAWLIV
ncbi:hypothetical protein KYC_08080 [Achromobacter arsenitoxydans SY8]|uniref:Uncharacterized protein n=1 Tax=Achromobacter arsenitoxydans SY8 TaxID=477184 RepID=H0F4C4_9BURK|nr:hypothetical protein KYC_08080 [Achromobacter arsenitoxydans SY8]